MKEYTIPELIQTFEAHAKQFEEQKIAYREKNGEPPYDDSFNIAAAMLCFAIEIEKLSKKT